MTNITKEKRPACLTVFFAVLVIFTALLHLPAMAQNAPQTQPETKTTADTPEAPQTIIPDDLPKWMPKELAEMEAKFVELLAQTVTLDDYSPEKFPDFQELELTNQLVELLDFNRRKFNLLIKQYNQIEDQIFPFIQKHSKEHPELNRVLLAKVNEYGGDNPKSIILVQKRINMAALQIERLEKRIERVQLAAQKKEIAEGTKTSEIAKEISTTAKIQQLKENLATSENKIEEEKKRLAKLKEKEKNDSSKISEKYAEIKTFKEKNKKIKNPVEELINTLFAEVREIRLNGLEIPRLNTVKTFVYLTKTSLAALMANAKDASQEISSLEELRQQELLNKLIRGGVVIIIALIFVFILIKIAYRISKKIINRVEESDKIDDHRKQRYHTLSAVILSFFRIVLWSLAVLLVLGELEIDYGPFLVAAGGISLAIGFGAQSLVKDVVTGFFLLMEEQFALGDSIEVNGKTGTVEKISLRTIKFRGLDGTLHIIPNGNISSVSNKTYQWSRAVVKVGVSYNEKPEKVLEILEEIGRDFAKEPEWEEKLLDAPTAQGILDLAESAIEFRLLAKTKPGDHWAVARELNIRIKNAFDKNGIEIPYNYINVINKAE